MHDIIDKKKKICKRQKNILKKYLKCKKSPRNAGSFLLGNGKIYHFSFSFTSL